MINSPESKMIIIGGSPRKNGNSDVLAAAIAKGSIESGIDTEIIHLRDFEFSSCIGCEQCRKTWRCSRFKDGMQEIYPLIVQSKGIVLISPVHNYNMTAWMKAFIDRLYCFYHFEYPRPGKWSAKFAGQGRKAVVAAVCEQPDPRDMGYTLPLLRMPLEALGYDVLADFPVLKTFEKGAVADLPATIQKAVDMGKLLAAAISKDT